MSRFPLRSAPLALAAALALAGSSLHAQGVASGFSATPLQFNIAAKPLAQALSDWALQTRLQLIVEPALVSGKTAPAITGNLTSRQALNLLLEGSGLVGVQDGNAIVVKPAGSAGDGATLGTVTVTAQMDRSDIASEGTGAYAARGASIMKSAESLRDIPQSVTVVTRQRMDDFGLTRMEDVLSQTPGLSLDIAGAGNKLFVSRGFEIRNMQVDGVSKGFWGGTSAMGIQPDMAMYDRVEVLRGAAGLLLGNGTPGGTVNFVRKRPLAKAAVDVEVQAGSWNNYRSMVDATGPLNADGSLRGRAVVSYEDRGYYTRNTKTQQPFFYGVLEYDLTPQTRLTVGGRYQHFDKDGAYWYGGLPSSTDGSDLRLNRRTSFGPDWAFYKAETQEYFAEARHDFNDRWTLKVAGNYQETQRSDSTLWLRGNADPRTLTGAYMVASATPDEKLETKSIDANVTGKFDLWGREHTVVFGGNRLEEVGVGSSFYDYANRIPVSLDNPYQVGVAEKYVEPNRNDERTVSQGVYGSLRLQVADPVKLVLGGRLSWYEYSDRLNAQSTIKQTRKFTPYAGLLVDVAPNWTAYASYTDIFEPQSGNKTVTGAPLKPAMGTNYEVGIKGELLDGRLNTSLSAFYINQDDRAMVDPDNAVSCPGSNSGGPCYINGGKVQSKGIEAEVNGEIVPGLQAWLGYTYNRQVYVIDRNSAGQPTSNEGKTFNSISPRHILRAGASYRFSGDLNKLTLGGGMSAQSETGYASSNIWRQQSGYTVWNAFARYQINPRWALSLNINNLFDKTYYTSPGRNFYGEPRSAMLTLRGRF